MLSDMPLARGLYDPRFEHDACGVGFIVHIKGQKSHEIVHQGLELLKNLTHRGAVGADIYAGDGAGILIQMPDAFLRAECDKLSISLPEAGDYAAGMSNIEGMGGCESPSPRAFCMMRISRQAPNFQPQASMIPTCVKPRAR